MDGSSTIEQPEPTTRKASSLTAAQRAPLSVLSAALASVSGFFSFLFSRNMFQRHVPHSRGIKVHFSLGVPSIEWSHYRAVCHAQVQTVGGKINNRPND